jgi:Glucose / Sorbosone dehydrogenase
MKGGSNRLVGEDWNYRCWQCGLRVREAALTRGSAREIVLVNRTRKTVAAVATDMLRHTAGPSVDIVDGDYDALKGARTAGVNEKIGGAGRATPSHPLVNAERLVMHMLDWNGYRRRLFASGLRNPTGMAFEPQTGKLWAIVSERDEIGPNLVPPKRPAAGCRDWFSHPGRASQEAPLDSRSIAQERC